MIIFWVVAATSDKAGGGGSALWDKNKYVPVVLYRYSIVVFNRNCIVHSSIIQRYRRLFSTHKCVMMTKQTSTV
jgi:hypothetical protein